MQAYSELLPPTAVTHALKIPFLKPQTENLIVAKTSLLQIFEIASISHAENSVASAAFEPLSTQNPQATNGDTSSKSQQAKLVLIAEYPLSGTITSLARIKALNTKSGGEALLVSFKNAKASLVEWDPAAFSISTISIHYYEAEDPNDCPWSLDLSQCPSYLTADPSSRAAALKFGSGILAVIPFRQVGDELVADNFDSDLDGTPPQQTTSTAPNQDSFEYETPYAASFNLELSALDASLFYPIHLGFLYEYREPTLGVLSAAKNPSCSLPETCKDSLVYTAFTLDLEQRARTTLLSVTGLPSDLFRLQPLPKPVGGALLIGGNEIVHVDQAGKSHAIAVNPFARQASAFPMVDQSNLRLKLEHCVVEQINSKTGDMIVLLNTGQAAIISFRIDGRSVSGMSLRKATQNPNVRITGGPASCAVTLDKDLLFIGAEDNDSLLLRFNMQRVQLSRKRSHADMLGIEDAGSDDEFEEQEDDDDDLYAESGNMTNGHTSPHVDGSMEEFSFTVDDRLPNLASVGDPGFVPNSAAVPGSSLGSQQRKSEKIKIVLATDRGEESKLTFISKEIALSTVKALPLSDIRRTWSLSPSSHKKSSTNGVNGSHNQDERKLDHFIITAGSSHSAATSKLYSLSSGNIEEVKNSYFDNDADTINSGLLCHGKRIVQVSQSEVRCLDSDLALSQIVPMLDEKTDAELSIVQSSFCDPYFLAVRDDSSIVVFKSDDRDDQLEELDRGDAVTSRHWATACLYRSRTADSSTLAFTMTTDGTLTVFQLPNLENPLFQVEAANLIPQVLARDNAFRRAPNREKIVEILVADVGVGPLAFPTLILRTADDNLALYRPFPSSSEQPNMLLSEGQKWAKVVDTSLTKTYGYATENNVQEPFQQILRTIPNLDGYSVVFVGNDKPRLIISESSNMPKIIGMRGQLVDLNPIHTPDCPNGVVATSREGEAVLAQLNPSTRYGDSGMAVQQVEVGPQIASVCYHASSDLFVLGINEPCPFELPENDDWHQEWAKEDRSFPPTGNRAKVRLYDFKTSKTINEITLGTDEYVSTVKTALLEVSEITHERKMLVVVATAVLKGEDLPANGNIYVYDIVTVVPEPERPETNRSLKQIAQEEVKGAVTAVSEIGNEGFLLNAQGQKCMVRGLKEDGTMLPVAFLDIQCLATSLRNLKGTGLALIGDVFKGVWLVGFSVDPYQMKIFSRSKTTMEVVVSDFLPQKKQLFILVVDGQCNLHVLEFNPEDPKSLSGQRLLTRNLFYTGHFPVSMVSLPASFSPPDPTTDDGDVEMDDTDEISTQVYNALLTSDSGALALITPLDEQTYRRLAALQIYLTGLLDHPCGLNPRVYRAIESEAFGSRGVLDGQLLVRWYTLSSQRKAEASTRVGADVWQLHADLETIAGAGMEYL